MLETGQWLPKFNSFSKLNKIKQSLPNLLSIKSDQYEFEFNENRARSIKLNLQIQNSISGKVVKRNSFVELESDYKEIISPKNLQLNEKGTLNLSIILKNPKNNNKFDGLIFLRAYLDNYGYDDVSEGLLVLKVKNLDNKKTIQILPKKSLIKKFE